MHAARKSDHLRICLEKDVRPQYPGTGLDRFRFVHQALPETNLDEIDTRTQFLGRDLRLPLLISSMTGGTPAGGTINRRLAKAAQTIGIGMAVGSLRNALDEPQWSDTFRVRAVAPDILLLANLGAVQLGLSYGIEQCKKIVDMTEADGLVLHLNPLQEAMQPDGDTQFRGLLSRITALCSALSVPVLVKEVGCGLSRDVAVQLAEAGVSALDIAGAGGTSWSEVERHRIADPARQRVAALFRGWGIPTAESLRTVRCALPHLPLIASGGIETGIDVAKCIALGADMAGMAWPLLRPATQSVGALLQEIQVIEQALRIAMFCIGAPNIASLKNTPYLQEVGT